MTVEHSFPPCAAAEAGSTIPTPALPSAGLRARHLSPAVWPWRTAAGLHSPMAALQQASQNLPEDVAHKEIPRM